MLKNVQKSALWTWHKNTIMNMLIGWGRSRWNYSCIPWHCSGV